MKPIEIVIEAVAGSAVKYKFEPTSGSFHLRKILPLGMVFPYHFGFLPGTTGEDGDPLDAMVISEHVFFTGANLKCRLIGALLAYQSEGRKKNRNDRYFFIPVDSVVFKHSTSITDFGAEHNEQLKDFFVNYNKAEGKKFLPGKFIAPSLALSHISKSSE